GPVIAETALLIPDRLVALIGVDTFHDIGLIATDKQINFLMAPMRADFKKGCQFFCRTMFTPKSDRALIDKIANDMSSAPPKIALSAMEELFKNDTPATIKKIKVPCRCINADKFPFNVEAARKHFVSFDIKIMKGVGHFLMMEAPKSFNKLLHDTISELISR
ncbi:MAG: alpha/beta hydrolase, partial [bacterium]|nr:alpha/beta hydrolase [bacterium]